MQIPTRIWIGGEWVDSASGSTFAVHNPATGELLADVAEGDEPEVDRAVKAARTAMDSPEWRDLGPHDRSVLLWRLADLIEANADELGTLETRDNGKPYFEAQIGRAHV